MGTKEEHDEEDERKEHAYVKSWKGLGKIPTLSDFDDSYKETIRDTKKFYNNSEDLIGPFNKFIRGKKL